MNKVTAHHARRIQRRSFDWQVATVQAFAIVVGIMTTVKINMILGILFTAGLFLYGLQLSKYWACSHCNDRLESGAAIKCRNCGARLD